MLYKSSLVINHFHLTYNVIRIWEEILIIISVFIVALFSGRGKNSFTMPFVKGDY